MPSEKIQRAHECDDQSRQCPDKAKQESDEPDDGITLLLMLLDERIATGSAITQPMTVPRIDILMVSIKGETTFGKNDQSGWKNFLQEVHHLAEFCR